MPTPSPVPAPAQPDGGMGAEAGPELAPHLQAPTQQTRQAGLPVPASGAIEPAAIEPADPGQGAPALASPPPTPDTAASPEAASDADTPPLPVLYIDDNPVNTLLMMAMFERLKGLQLRCENDPASGVASARAAPPALLLVDIQMPQLDGFEVLRQLRQAPATRDVPAIAVSANAMAQDVARGRAAGFADYLTKPLELPRLLAALKAALPGWAAPPDGPL